MAEVHEAALSPHTVQVVLSVLKKYPAVHASVVVAVNPLPAAAAVLNVLTAAGVLAYY